MDTQRLQEIGSRLGELEAQRRSVMAELVQAIGQKHDERSRALYGQLSEISYSAVRLLTEQREIAERAVGNLHLPGQPGHYMADTPGIGRAT
jgi:tetrahydromethanopterin S-methyltransferase subunit G